jgi:hypothetical protein
VAAHAVAPAPSGSAVSLATVRAGRNACYDRLILDLSNAPGRASHTVGYHTVDGVGTGTPVPVAGGAALEIVVRAHGNPCPWPIRGRW